MVRVCNKGEEEAFLAGCSYLLYGCRVWWDDIDKVTNDLPSLSNPNYPCTRILPCYFYLGLRFHFSQLWKEILMYFQFSFRNLTLTFVRMTFCFEHLNERYHGELFLHEFLVLYTPWKSAKTLYFFQSPCTLW